MTIDQQILTIDQHTRPGQPLPRVTGVVIHYVQWPGATAQRIRDYFDALPRTEPGRYASAHYAVGLEGEVIQMVPEEEVAWHAGPSSKTRREVETRLGGKPNWRTIGIELCHPDASGAFLRATWNAAVALTADIMQRHGIAIETRILRHYDCTGKLCPLWMVNNGADWTEFVRETGSRT